MQFKLQQFEGPLDLLLSLIEERKLEITTVSISTVTEQFLSYIDSLQEERPEELADFLLIAARLLLLKSRRLLDVAAPDEDGGPTLEEQLRLYKAFQKASRDLHRRWLGNIKSFFRVEPSRRPTSFVPPQNVTLPGLHESMVQLLRRLQPPKPIEYATIDKALSVKERIDYVRNLLRDVKNTSFSKLISDSKNKTEVIVNFLALLELVKMKVLDLQQENTFGDIQISAKVN